MRVREPQHLDPPQQKSTRVSSHGLSSIHSRYDKVLQMMKDNKYSMANAYHLSGCPRSTLHYFIAIAGLKKVDSRAFEIYEHRRLQGDWSLKYLHNMAESSEKVSFCVDMQCSLLSRSRGREEERPWERGCNFHSNRVMIAETNTELEREKATIDNGPKAGSGLPALCMNRQDFSRLTNWTDQSD